MRGLRLSVVMVLLAAFGVERCSATTIDLSGILGALIAALPDFASVGGVSTDGANFGSVSNPPTGVAQADGVAHGTMGTFSSASAQAFSPIAGLPGEVTTFAVTVAGRGQTSSAFAIAKAGSMISVSAQIDGAIHLKIDPYLLNDGIGSAMMSFDLMLNGLDLFTASASLDNGVLTTAGAFSPADFQLGPSGAGTTVAVLTTTDFSIPVTILPSIINQLEFDQSVSVSSTNSGSAAAGTPEPWPSALVGFGLAMLWGYRRRS